LLCSSNAKRGAFRVAQGPAIKWIDFQWICLLVVSNHISPYVLCWRTVLNQSESGSKIAQGGRQIVFNYGQGILMLSAAIISEDFAPIS
jgi:hypothetical protein